MINKNFRGLIFYKKRIKYNKKNFIQKNKKKIFYK